MHITCLHFSRFLALLLSILKATTCSSFEGKKSEQQLDLNFKLRQPNVLLFTIAKLKEYAY